MKNLGLILLSVIILLGCSKAPSEVLLDSFEGDISDVTVDFGSSDNSSVKVTAEKNNYICGAQALKIDYDLKTSGYMWIARGYDLDVKGAACWEVEPKDVKWKKYNALSINMNGTNAGGVVAFDIKDAGGELFRFLLDDDKNGWKTVICPFEHFFPRKDWQPETAQINEKIDFPIKSFQFEPRLPGKGVYLFDCVKVIKLKK